MLTQVAAPPRLAFERRGSGPPLLLLHPLGADRHVWAPVLDRLARERDVVCVDLPGFGGSAPLEGDSSPAALAAAVAEFADALGIGGSVHVAGNSLGGWVALELALAGHGDGGAGRAVGQPGTARERGEDVGDVARGRGRQVGPQRLAAQRGGDREAVDDQLACAQPPQRHLHGRGRRARAQPALGEPPRRGDEARAVGEAESEDGDGGGAGGRRHG